MSGTRSKKPEVINSSAFDLWLAEKRREQSWGYDEISSMRGSFNVFARALDKPKPNTYSPELLNQIRNYRRTPFA